MPDDKNPESPATTSLAYDAMVSHWQKVQTVLDGTEAMRAAGQAYLPMHANEENEAYDERLARSTLFNVTELTLDSWVGRPFSDPITYEDMPKEIEALLDNVDLAGTNAHVFCANWFGDGIAKAFSHVYVDFPRVEQPEGRPRTKADDDRDQLRPYWVHIRPQQLIFADAEVMEGREVLREIRIREEEVERDGFAEVVVPQIRRVFIEDFPMEDSDEFETRTMVQLWRLEDPAKEGEEDEKWIVHDQWFISLAEIPLVTFYADRDMFMHGKPPLEDLADLNIAHWQSTSDQRAILTVTRFPLLALSGGQEEGKVLVIGPNRWLYSPDPASKFYYVEHTGAAIAAGRDDLRDLEAQMSEYGAEFLKKRPGEATATARALDSAEATSALGAITMRFMGAYTQVLDLSARWLNMEDGGRAILTTDFGPEELTQSELNTLRETRKMKDISRESYLEELKRYGLLSDEFDIKKDFTKLEDEAEALFGEPLEEETKPGEEDDETKPGDKKPEEEPTDET